MLEAVFWYFLNERCPVEPADEVKRILLPFPALTAQGVTLRGSPVHRAPGGMDPHEPLTRVK